MGLNFNYDVIIDLLSTPAISFCVEQLYPLFNYRVTRKEDVRAIDLKEKFYPLVSYMDKKVTPKGRMGSTNYYLSLIKMYLVEFINCKKGSRVERYKNLAITLIDNYDEISSSDLTREKDIFMIYLSLFRSLGGNIEIANTRVILDATFDVEESDVDIINTIWKSDKLIPKGMYDTKNDLFNRKKIVSSDYDIKQKRQFFYAISILLLADSLQDRGALSDTLGEELEEA